MCTSITQECWRMLRLSRVCAVCAGMLHRVRQSKQVRVDASDVTLTTFPARKSYTRRARHESHEEIIYFWPPPSCPCQSFPRAPRSGRRQFCEPLLPRATTVFLQIPRAWLCFIQCSPTSSSTCSNVVSYDSRTVISTASQPFDVWLACVR